MNELTGKPIGRYHVIEPLGEGGMATVYKAYDTRLDCDVAIKVIRNERLGKKDTSIAIERFRVEAQKMARLSHPNIVPVIDYGEVGNQPYLVMKYIAGGTLKNMIGKPMPYQTAARLLIPIAQALEVAHQSNLIHRDVKPSNILVTNSGQPMLSDFGIAKIIDPEETSNALTITGMAIGTPEYMAPEQWEGKQIDGKVDIYALGVVFYEMITGRRPFQAETVPAVMVKVLRDPLPSPRAFIKDLPTQVERVLYKALSRNPENRYATMQFFVDDLEKLANGSVSKTKVSLKKLALISTSFILTMTILGVAINYFYNRKNPAAFVVSTNQQTGTAVSGSNNQISERTVISATLVPATTPLPPNATPTLPPTIAPTPTIFSAQFNGLYKPTDFTFFESFDRYGDHSYGNQVSISDGVLIIGRDGTIDGSSIVRHTLTPNSTNAFLVLFSIKESSHCAITLTTGKWGGNSYRRWGADIDRNIIREDIEYGPKPDYLGGNLISGSLVKPGEWYFALLQVGQNSQFKMKIWEADNPSNLKQYDHTFNEEWNPGIWYWNAWCGEGQLSIDEYYELKITE